jgi:hypothetical protein
MRHIRSVLVPAVLALLAGCVPHSPFMRDNSQTRGPIAPPDAATLVRSLNDNAARLESVECLSLAIDAREGNQPVGLTGMMSCQKPRNFRLQANLFGSPAVDMGSNRDEFWYWISKADPPYLIHCAYQDLATGKVYLPFPFQPDWVLETLGMATCNPEGKYQVKMVTRTDLQLIEETVSSQGQPVRKVTVFDLTRQSSGSPQVKAHILQDAAGKDICMANILDVRTDKVSGAMLPYRLTLVWPEQKVQMTLKLDSVRINQLTDQTRVARLFTRPQLENVRSVDLAQLQQARPTGLVQRVSGPARRLFLLLYPRLNLPLHRRRALDVLAQLLAGARQDWADTVDRDAQLRADLLVGAAFEVVQPYHLALLARQLAKDLFHFLEALLADLGPRHLLGLRRGLPAVRARLHLAGRHLPRQFVDAGAARNHGQIRGQAALAAELAQHGVVVGDNLQQDFSSQVLDVLRP